MGVSLRDEPAFAPILPLGAGEGANVRARHPVPELEVIGADLALSPSSPDQGVEVLEDGGAGAHPTNISMKWAKTATRRMEWGVR
jgi:hypothetical protein